MLLRTASRAVTAAALLVTAAALGGCATLDHGTLDDVPVVTDPPGANVVSSTGTICVSPCAVSGPRDVSFAVTITKPGYVTQSVTSVAKPNDAAIGTASALTATPDLLGRIIDVQDGSYYTHVPKALVVKLAPES